MHDKIKKIDAWQNPMHIIYRPVEFNIWIIEGLKWKSSLLIMTWIFKEFPRCISKLYLSLNASIQIDLWYF